MSLPTRWRNERGDDGQSLVEAVALGLALLIPLITAVIAATSLHRATLAADAAAREALRSWTVSASSGEGRTRAVMAARHAVSDYGFDPSSLSVQLEGSLVPGSQVAVVTRLPLRVFGISISLQRRAVGDVDRLRASEGAP
jgi:hypothetical protein